jgi:hypothetical protein
MGFGQLDELAEQVGEAVTDTPPHDNPPPQIATS